MAERAIIRLGDPTSHGGTVLEAFPTLDVYGKNAAGIGHKGYCPRCKREFVIVAGAENFTFFGKNVAVEGMHTSCGAVLIATQHQAVVDNTPSGQTALDSNLIHMPPGRANDGAGIKEPGVAEDPYDEQPQLVAPPIDGVPYYVETMDGRTFSGRTRADGLLPRIDTNGEDEYAVYWGDEALAKMEGAEA